MKRRRTSIVVLATFAGSSAEAIHITSELQRLPSLKRQHRRIQGTDDPPEIDVSTPPSGMATLMPSSAPTLKPTTNEPTFSPSLETTTQRPSPRPATQSPVERPTQFPTQKSVSSTTLPTPSSPSITATPDTLGAVTNIPSIERSVAPTPSPFAFTLFPTAKQTMELRPTHFPTRGPTRLPAPPFEQSSRSPAAGSENSQPTLVPVADISVDPTRSPNSNVVLPDSAPPTTSNPVPVSIPVEFESIVSINSGNADDEVREIEQVWEAYLDFELWDLYREDVSVQYENVELRVELDSEKSIPPLASDPSNDEQRYLRKRRRVQEDGQQNLVSQSLTVEASGQAQFMITDPSQLGSGELVEQTNDALGTILTASRLESALQDASIDANVTEVQRPQDQATTDENRSSSEDRPTFMETVAGFTVAGIAMIFLGWTVFKYLQKRRKRAAKKRLEKARQGGIVAAVPPRSSAVIMPPQNLETYSSSSEDGEKPSFPTLSSIVSEGDSEATSEFGRELREAATNDREAWEELQRKKARYSVISELRPPATANTPDTSRVSSFPYGDEASWGASETDSSIEDEEAKSSSTPHEAVELQLTNSLKFRATASLLDQVDDGEGSGEDDHDEFDLYGDRKGSPVLNDTFDGVSDGRPSPTPFSFMYPLKDTPSEASTSQDVSSMAIRLSPTTSSWSPTEDEREVKVDESEEALETEDMLDELQRLSAYVKSYEQEKLARQNLAPLEPTPAVLGAQYSSDSDSLLGGGDSGEEEERLGITRRRVQRPTSIPRFSQLSRSPRDSSDKGDSPPRPRHSPPSSSLVPPSNSVYLTDEVIEPGRMQVQEAVIQRPSGSRSMQMSPSDEEGVGSLQLPRRSNSGSAVAQPKRLRNNAFNSIVSLFESKPNTSVTPPRTTVSRRCSVLRVRAHLSFPVAVERVVSGVEILFVGEKFGVALLLAGGENMMLAEEGMVAA